MPYLLNILYLFLIICCSPYLTYVAIRTGKYRDGWSSKFLGRVPLRTGKRQCVWLHAVSVGEVNMLQPILAELTTQQPTWECVISTTTRTGFALARKKYANFLVFYCPLDFSWAVQHAMRRIRPHIFLLAELELWPNLIRGARQHGARVAVVNGRLSEKSFRGYQRIRPLIRRVLHRIDLIATQNQEYADRFLALGARPETVHVTGSIKFDGAQTDRSNPATEGLRQWWGVTEETAVFLAGSTQAPEEQMALEAYSHAVQHYPDTRLIIVPRHPEHFEEVARLLEQSGLPWIRRSAGTGSDSIAEHDARVLLVDVVGELGAWWGMASVGYVGGSMGRRGGQNMIEPAAYGVAVSFGPNTWNFRDTVAMLLHCDGAVVVQDQLQLNTFVLRCLKSPDFAQQLGHHARRLVLEQQGATQRTAERLITLMPPPQAGQGDPSLTAA